MVIDVDGDGKADKPTVEIRVIGKRWWWAFEYINEGITTGNQIAIPDDRPVSLLITSDTVIHSFWTPRIGGKRDAVPGRVNRMWFNLTEDVPRARSEHLRGECAEYCGEAHSLMRYEVLALDGADYDKWVAEYQAGPTFADDLQGPRGRRGGVHRPGGCVACHAITGNADAPRAPSVPTSPSSATVATSAPASRTCSRTAATDDSGGPRGAPHRSGSANPNSLKPGTSLLDNGTPRFDGMVIPKAALDGEIRTASSRRTSSPPKPSSTPSSTYLLAQKSAFPLPVTPAPAVTTPSFPVLPRNVPHELRRHPRRHRRPCEHVPRGQAPCYKEIWLTTVDHKLIGKLYLFTSLFFFMDRWPGGAVHSSAARVPREHVHLGADVQRDVHDARHDHDLPVDHAVVRCVLQLPDPAADRRP